MCGGVREDFLEEVGWGRGQTGTVPLRKNRIAKVCRLLQDRSGDVHCVLVECGWSGGCKGECISRSIILSVDH